MRIVISGILYCFLTLSWSAKSATPKQQRPNIIVILSDDMGFSDIGCYGGEIQTPNLDKLSENGLRFTQFYNAARCCPTRASLLTGVYQHQAGIGLMTENKNLPGYQGDLNFNVQTIAEVLKGEGYKTYMTGKWHVTKHVSPDGPKKNWPLQRGFDKFYGTIQGAGSFYDPTTLCRNNIFITPINDTEYQPETYYYTDAISDNAIKYIEENDKGDPFFLYMAYTTAHWPLHALPEDIEKYKGTYDKGYEYVRKKRFKRLKELGLIEPNWELSPTTENWDDVENKSWEIRNMETYAAMIDRMDQGIGRLLEALKDQGRFDNTIIMFLQDNGGCAEGYGRGPKKDSYPTNLIPMGKDELQTRAMPPMQTRDGRPVKNGRGNMAGPDDSYCGYGKGWANVSNTPFREYKHYVQEGGIATPFIVSWPCGINKNLDGKVINTPAHIIDIMATCVDISGADYPEKVNDQEIIPMEGTSLKNIFLGQTIQKDRPLFFEHHLNAALRKGKWKLVRKGNPREKKVYDWELYNMEKDRTEMHNLAADRPDLMDNMIEQWNKWTKRALVKPSPWDAE